ncbi:unnamed protein product, partial [Mesorhabditis belari]|uniref:Tumor protein D52 n=1 Tax=Mesorhabditis belari TaxID=2138241 RepID=A0AAF3EYZ9_9BILA
MPPKKKQGPNQVREKLVQKPEETPAGEDKSVDDLADRLAKESDSDDAEVINEQPTANTPLTKPAQKKAESAFGNADGTPLSDAERELLKEELKKTEDEITTLKQVLLARQKHSSELKRKLGLNPLTELTQDINKTLKGVTETDAYKTTSEVAGAAADSVKNKWNDMRNSNLFKSFESKLGTAYTSAKIAASTSIDHLSGAARGSQATTPATEEAKSPMH